MKMLRYISVIAMSLMFFSFFPFQAGAQDDVKYIGEICYSIDEDTLLMRPPIIGRLGVLSFGTGHFVLSGVYGGLLPVNGTAFIRADNNIVISLYSSYSSGGLSVTYMVIDATSLKGNYTMMVVETAHEPPIITTLIGSARLSLCN